MTSHTASDLRSAAAALAAAAAELGVTLAATAPVPLSVARAA
jgi:hypothetical protein